MRSKTAIQELIEEIRTNTLISYNPYIKSAIDLIVRMAEDKIEELEKDPEQTNVYFKAKRIDNGELVVGFFTKKKIGALIVPVIEVYKEWDSGDYIETYEVDGNTVCCFNGN